MAAFQLKGLPTAMKRKDITAWMQRLEAFEERLNVRFEALSAFETKQEFDEEHEVVVRGELHSVSGTKIVEDIDIQLSVYDCEGRVIQTESEFVDSDRFFGFHTFEMRCSVPPKTVAKIRLVPKLS